MFKIGDLVELKAQTTAYWNKGKVVEVDWTQVSVMFEGLQYPIWYDECWLKLQENGIMRAKRVINGK